MEELTDDDGYVTGWTDKKRGRLEYGCMKDGDACMDGWLWGTGGWVGRWMDV